MSNANPLELLMLGLINAERSAAGLDPLRPITLLNDAAEMHSNWMLETNTFSHDGIDGSSPSERMEDAGYPFEGNSLSLENIGWQSARGDEGFEDDVAQVHESLMASPGHRENILNPDAEDIGIGIEIGTFTGDGGDYEAVMVTQVFGTTDADLSSWIDPQTGEPAEDVIKEDEVIEENSDDPDEMMTEEICEEIIAEIDEIETPEGEPVAGDDLVPIDTPTEDPNIDDMPEINDPEVPLPFELSEFKVDLSNAFDFRQEGDQLIWETSEDRLVDAFMDAINEWAGGQIIEDPDVLDLMTETLPDDAEMMPAPEEELDDWLLDCA